MGVHLFEDLPKVMEKHAAQIVSMVTLAVQKAALAGGDHLASQTPVDTGVARSNWIMSVDRPIYSVVPAYVPYPSYSLKHQAGEADSFSRKDEVANLAAVRVQHSLAASRFKSDTNQSIHVANSSPHIALLNEGRSHQTEAGFFSESVTVARKAVLGVWRLKDIP